MAQASIINSLEKIKRDIDNWYISKLELFQNIPTSICTNGANIQWLANVTKHAYIAEIKAHNEAWKEQAGSAGIPWKQTSCWMQSEGQVKKSGELIKADVRTW